MQTQQLQEDPLDSLGGRIRAAREARKISTTKMARAIGLSRTTCSLWQSGVVKRPDRDKLIQFSKLAQVSYEWLEKRTGPDPVIIIKAQAKKPPGKQKRPSRKERPPTEAPMPDTTRGIPEITPNLDDHAIQIGAQARDYWIIPDDVIMRSFNAQPGKIVMQQVTSRTHDGIVRGDYVLIDLSRTVIDEPGVYLLADTDRKRAKRAVVTANNGNLKIMIIGDDQSREIEPGERVTTLGRIMGVFHPV